MMKSMSVAFFLALVSLVAPLAVQAGNQCARISTTLSFDIDWFTEKTWYIHQMKSSGRYHDEDKFCALITFDTIRGLTRTRGRYTAHTFAKQNILSNVNDIRHNPFLCLTWPNDARMSLMSCFYPTDISTPLYVVALDKTAGWVVAVEGQPDIDELSSSCTSAGICGNKRPLGIYIMTRSATRNDSVLSAARAAAIDAGVCMDQVDIDVVQSGCSYQGARIK